MSTSRDKLELRKRAYLLRENNELALQKSKKASSITKPVLDLGDEDSPTPDRGKKGCDTNITLEGLTGYSDDVERSFDEVDLLDWIEELVSGWGIEPHYEEVLAAMKKEPKVLQGFLDNFGPARLRQLTKDELFRMADEMVGHTDSEDAMFQESSDKDSGSQKPWEKSKERKEERQKDIEKGSVKEQADVPLAADARTHRLKFIVELLKFSGAPTEEPVVQAALSKLTPEDSKKLDIFLEKLAHAGDKVSEMLDAAMEKAERSGMRSAGREPVAEQVASSPRRPQTGAPARISSMTSPRELAKIAQSVQYAGEMLAGATDHMESDLASLKSRRAAALSVNVGKKLDGHALALENIAQSLDEIVAALESFEK